MIYEPYSVVMVPFPFTDKQHVKRRPALVISSKEYQTNTHHVTLAMITSAKNSQWKGDHTIRDLEDTHLVVASIVRQKIFTIDASLVIKQLGKLSERDKRSFKKSLKEHLF